MDMRLEVVVIPVSDVDRAKRFYESLGFRLDIDYAAPGGDYRILQFTPPASRASIIFGKGITSARPGSVDRMILAVDDIDAARQDLLAQGVAVGEVFHDAGGGLAGGFYAGTTGRAAGPDPQGRSYATYASFNDPDGNGWMLQEIRERLPGREWKPAGATTDASTLADLLRETEERHGRYEKTHAEHHWWDWYAPYLGARQNGSSPEVAAAVADRHMDQDLHVLPR